MITTVTLTGMDEVMRIFSLLPMEMEKTIIAEAAKEALKPMLDAAKAKCPVYEGPPRPDVIPGQGRASLKIKARRGNGTIGAQVITGAGDFKGDEFYMSFVEFGHGIGKRGSVGRTLRERAATGLQRVPEHPFLRPAFDETKDECLTRFGEEIKNRVSAVIGQPL